MFLFGIVIIIHALIIKELVLRRSNGLLAYVGVCMIRSLSDLKMEQYECLIEMEISRNSSAS